MRRVLLCLALLGSPAFAQDPKGPAAEGEYGGVQPGQTKKPESAKKPKRAPSKGTLSWIGFEAKDGGSDVFFQSVAPFEVTQRLENGTLIVTLNGLSKLAHNTGRPIDTRFFDSPVSRVSAKKKGRAIEVRITFKDAKQATTGTSRSATEADGMYYTYLSFSGGGAPTIAPSDE